MKLKKLALCLGMAAALVIGTQPVLASDQLPYVALGADLNSEQRATVLKLLGLTESDLTNEDRKSVV